MYAPTVFSKVASCTVNETNKAPVSIVNTTLVDGCEIPSANNHRWSSLERLKGGKELNNAVERNPSNRHVSVFVHRERDKKLNPR